jgi:hypothetical protein
LGYKGLDKKMGVLMPEIKKYMAEVSLRGKRSRKSFYMLPIFPFIQMLCSLVLLRHRKTITIVNLFVCFIYQLYISRKGSHQNRKKQKLKNSRFGRDGMEDQYFEIENS